MNCFCPFRATFVGTIITQGVALGLVLLGFQPDSVTFSLVLLGFQPDSVTFSLVLLGFQPDSVTFSLVLLGFSPPPLITICIYDTLFMK